MDEPKSGPSRRNLFSVLGIAAVGQAAATLPAAAVDPSKMTLNVNGRDYRLTLDTRPTLLDALREHIGLTGSKKGCDQGQCGACTIHIDGNRVLSCLTLAVTIQGRKVETIEGLAKPDGTLHPVQQAFIDQDGFQCGILHTGPDHVSRRLHP